MADTCAPVLTYEKCVPLRFSVSTIFDSA